MSMSSVRSVRKSMFYLLLKLISLWASSILIPIITLVHQKVRVNEPLVGFSVIFELFLACDAIFGYFYYKLDSQLSCNRSIQRQHQMQEKAQILFPVELQTGQSDTFLTKVVMKPSSYADKTTVLSQPSSGMCLTAQFASIAQNNLLFDMTLNVFALFLLVAMFYARIPLILLSLPWILKAYRLYPQYIAMVVLLQTRRVVNPLSEPMLRMIFLAVFGCWLLSLFACIWFVAGCGFNVESGDHCHGSWIAADAVLNLESGISRYLRSLHFVAQTFFTVGFGDIFPVTDLEFLFAIVALIISSLFFGSLVSSMASLIANRDVVLNKFRVEITKLNTGLDVCRVSEAFSSHTKNFFNVLFARQNGLLESKIFCTDAGLPHRIRSIHMNRFQPMLRQVPYFKLSPKRLVSACLQRMQFRSFGVGYTIVREGDFKRDLYLLLNGRLQISLVSDQGDSVTLSELVAGDFFGDYHLFFGTESEVTVTVIEFSEVLVLDYCSLTDAFLDTVERSDCGYSEIDSCSNGSETERDENSDNNSESSDFVDQREKVENGDQVVSSLHPLQLDPKFLSMCQNLCLIAKTNPPVDSFQSISSDLDERTSKQRRLSSKSIKSKISRTSFSAALSPDNMSVQATLLSHSGNLKRYVRAKNTLENTRGKKKIDEMMRDVSVVSRIPYTISTSHPFRLLWDLFFMFSIVYYALSSPVRLADAYRARFMNRPEISPGFYCMDYIVDGFVVLDFLLRYLVFQPYEFEILDRPRFGTILFVDRDTIRSSFVSSTRFYIMLALLPPYDLFALGPCESVDITLSFCRLPKLLSLGIFSSCFGHIFLFLEKNIGFVVGNDLTTILYLIVATVVSTVWFSCIWDIIYESYEEPTHRNWFINRLYWCLTTMTTTGYGDVVPFTSYQTFFVIICETIGPMIFATIVATFSSYVHSAEVSLENIDHRLKTVSAYITNLPDGLYKKLSGDYASKYFEFISTSRKSIPETSVIGSLLPRHLQDLMTEEIAMELLKDSQIFAKCSPVILKQFALSMEKQLFPKATVIVDVMPPCSGIYFIRQGNVNIFNLVDKSRRPQHLFKGESFMNTAIFEETHENSVLVRSSTDCELWFLSKIKFDKVIADFCLRKQRIPCCFDIDYMKNTAYGRKNDSRAAPKPDLGRLLSMKESRENSSFVLMPTCSVLRIWAFILLFSNIYSMITLPFFISFWAYMPISRFYFFEVVFDIIFILDILLRAFFIAYYEKDILIDSRTKIMRNYIFSSGNNFLCHIIASLPLEFLTLFGRCFGSSSHLCRYVYLLRLNKIFRFVNVRDQTIILENLFCNFELHSAFKFFVSYSMVFIQEISGMDHDGWCYRVNDEEVPKHDKDGLSGSQGSLYMQSVTRRITSVATAEKLTSIRQGFIGYRDPEGHKRIKKLETEVSIISRPIPSVKLSYFSLLSSPNEESAYASSKRSTKSFRKNMFRMLNLIFIIFVAAHVVGCMFFVIGSELSRSGQDLNWVNAAMLVPSCITPGNETLVYDWNCPEALESDIIFNQYVAALYWSTFTLTTVGYGDISAVSETERVFNVFVFIGGVAVYASVIAYIQEILSQLDVTTDIAEMRRSRVNDFLRRENIQDEDLYHKSEVYFKQLWLKQMGATGEEIKEFMPPGIHINIVLAMVDPFIDRMFYIRKSKSIAFLQAWASSLEPVWKLSGDELFVRGQMATRLYVVLSGDVELHEKSKREVSTKGPVSDKNTSFSIFNKGPLGEYEFYYGIRYCCCATVQSEALFTFEISNLRFRELLSEYDIEDDFEIAKTENAEIVYKSSTSYQINKLMSNLTSSKMNKMILSKPVERIDPFVVLPESCVAVVWDILNIVVILYVSFSVPFYIAFSGNSAKKIGANVFVENYLQVFLVDVLIFLFLIVDSVLQSQVFAVRLETKLIIKRKDIMEYYFQHGMKIDALSLFPLALILWFVYLPTSSDRVIGSVAIAMSRVLLFSRLLRLGSIFERAISIIERFVLKSRISIPSIRIVKAVLLVIFFCHLIACTFCFIGLHEDCDLIADQDKCSWISRNIPDSAVPGSFAIYIRALIWSAYTVTTTGYGNIVPVTKYERIFSIIVMIIGTMLCDHGIAAILGSIIAASDSRSSESMRVFLSAKKFLERHSTSVVPDICLNNKEILELRNYFLYLAKASNNCTDVEDFSLIPYPLRINFMSQFAFRGLSSVFGLLYREFTDEKVLSDADVEGFVINLLDCAELYIGIPGEILISTSIADTMTALSVEGTDRDFQDISISDDIFILRRGIVEVVSVEGDLPTKQLDAGGIICNPRHFLGCNTEDIGDELCFHRCNLKTKEKWVSIDISALEFVISSESSLCDEVNLVKFTFFSDDTTFQMKTSNVKSHLISIGPSIQKMQLDFVEGSKNNSSSSPHFKFVVPTDSDNILCEVVAIRENQTNFVIGIFKIGFELEQMHKYSLISPCRDKNENLSEIYLHLKLSTEDIDSQGFSLRFTATCLDYCHMIRIKYQDFKTIRKFFSEAFVTLLREKTVKSRLASSRAPLVTRKAFIMSPTKTLISSPKSSITTIETTQQIETLLESLHGGKNPKVLENVVEDNDEESDDS